MTSLVGRIAQARLDPDTLALLARLRQRTGLSESELLRRGLRRLGDDMAPARRARVIGVGKFASAVNDLASNKRHLRGFWRP